MAAMIPEQGIGRAQVQGAGGEAKTVAVPASALRRFLNLLTEMSQGNAVTLIPFHAEWTTQLTGDRIDYTRYQTLRPSCRQVPVIRRPFAAGIRNGPMRPGRGGPARRSAAAVRGRPAGHFGLDDYGGLVVAGSTGRFRYAATTPYSGPSNPRNVWVTSNHSPSLLVQDPSISCRAAWVGLPSRVKRATFSKPGSKWLSSPWAKPSVANIRRNASNVSSPTSS